MTSGDAGSEKERRCCSAVFRLVTALVDPPHSPHQPTTGARINYCTVAACKPGRGAVGRWADIEGGMQGCVHTVSVSVQVHHPGSGVAKCQT